MPFPKGYWLYERSKHLWVSGYPIKSKLFKTPQEFALHLIWLCTSSKDYKDCSCVHCNAPSIPKSIQAPDEFQMIAASEPPVKLEKPVTKTPTIPKVTPVPLPHIPGQPMAAHSPPAVKQQPQKPPTQTPVPVPVPLPVPVPAPAASAPTVTEPKPVTAPTPVPIPQPPAQTQVQAPIQPQTQPQPQPQVQPIAQPQVQTQIQTKPATPTQQVQTPTQSQQNLVWSLKSSPLFRVGELVWYQNGNTWRLGVISAVSGQISTAQNFDLIPIGHGMIFRQNVPKTAKDLRPFYAFSVPGVAIPELKDKIFDETPWEAMLNAVANDAGRRDLIALDASKMAASKIDCSFSLWAPQTQNEDAKAKVIPYYGCFLGAERVEVGDCLRLKPVAMDIKINYEALIMGLRYIITIKGHPSIPHFRGHIYVLVKGEATTAQAAPEETLPIALREEIKWRNHVNAAAKWRAILVKENVTIKEQQIRGRFYPTHRLMPILNPQGFTADAQMAQLNSRMDGNGRPIGQKRNRMDMLGASVAHTARLAFEPVVKELPNNDTPAS